MKLIPRGKGLSQNRLQLEDKVTVVSIVLVVVGILALMQIDTASLVFRYDDHFVEIDADAPPPKLDFEVEQLTSGSVRLRLDLVNIRLLEHCGQEDIGRAAGHAHIFVDNQKYSSVTIVENIIRDLSPGVHNITVSLNQPPTHKVIAWRGKPVSVTKTIVVT
jgi:hypothetical protein